MAFTDMQFFMRVLEARGLLKRVTVPVDAELEVTEIATRLVREGGPAVLFENVEGASYPLVVNLLGTMERIEIGLGAAPRRDRRGTYHVLGRCESPIGVVDMAKSRIGSQPVERSSRTRLECAGATGDR